MKKSILILGCFLISCVAFGHTQIEKNTNTETDVITTATDYAVVGTTNNSIGENYTLGITVRIDDMYGTMSVYVNGTAVSYVDKAILLSIDWVFLRHLEFLNFCSI